MSPQPQPQSHPNVNVSVNDLYLMIGQQQVKIAILEAHNQGLRAQLQQLTSSAVRGKAALPAPANGEAASEPASSAG